MCPYDPLNFHLSCNDLIMFFARFGYYTLICSCAYMAYTVDLQWYVQMSCTSTWLEWVPVHVIFINPCDLFVPLTNRIQFHVEAEFLTKYYMGAWKTKIEWIYWNNLVAYMTFLLWKLLYTIFKKKKHTKSLWFLSNSLWTKYNNIMLFYCILWILEWYSLVKAR